jgi:translation initiation factor 2B subunit (eIF-2B alpha/beta/delta family)
MSESVYLVGAESVRNAADTMVTVAGRIEASATQMEGTRQLFERSMQDFVERIERALDEHAKRIEAATDREAKP